MSAWTAARTLPKQSRCVWLRGVPAAILFFLLLHGTAQATHASGDVDGLHHRAAFSALPSEAIHKINAADPLEMLARAQGGEEVRVIVGLDVAFTPPGDLGVQAAASQQMDIASAQYRLARSLEDENLSSMYGFRYVPYMLMTVDAAGLQALLDSSLVSSIQEDIPEPYTLESSIPLIGADDAWAEGYDGTGRTVAILDSGVDKTHPFLTGSVVSEACYSTNASGGLYTATSLCPGAASSSTATDSAMPYIGVCESPDCDHGTHVAGIAAGYYSDTFAGVARQAQIIAVQVFTRFDSISYCGLGKSPCALSYASDQIRGMERVYALRDTYSIDAVNISIGGGEYFSNCDSDSRKSIIDALRSVGIATIISSGNEGYDDAMSAPACISTAISVGATTDSDTVASYSNTASFLTLLAPGSSINSSVPGGTYQSWNGTSMAAPHVTGTFAVLRQRSPDITIDELLNLLTTYGTLITDTTPEPDITKPRINVDVALSHMNSPTDLALTGYTVYENLSSGSIVGTLSSTDPDVGDTHSYTLVSGTGSEDNASFSIVDGALVTAAVFDYETRNTYSIRVRSTDNTAMWYEEALVIQITNVNDTPADITLNGTSVNENQPAVTTVGTFSTADQDVGDTHSYTLVSGTGSEDNASFSIVDGALVTAAVFDYETRNTYSVRVRTTDAGGLSYEEAITISITDYNPPTDISLGSHVVPENYASGTLVGTLVTVDESVNDVFTYTMAGGDDDSDNACFQIVGSQLYTKCLFDYESGDSRFVRIRTTDSAGLWYEEAFTISIIDCAELFLPLALRP